MSGVAQKIKEEHADTVVTFQLKPRVLVVDDDFVNRKIWEEVLEPHCQLDFAANGEEALKKFEEFYPNLVVLDRMMPGLHGDEVMAKIREMDANGDTKIVMHSMLESTNDQIEGMTKGADLYIPKSTDIDVAVTQVQSLLRLQKNAQSTTLFKIARDQNRKGGFASQFIAENIYRHASLMTEDIRAKQVDIRRIVKNVVTTVNDTINNVEILFTEEEGDMVIMGDDDLINHAFYTVIKRAVAASPFRSRIKIELTRVSEEIRLSVEDEGEPIPSSEWASIFHFECDDQKIQVGLPIAWETAQRHLGDLSVTKGEKGTKFIFRFPTPVKLEMMNNG